MFLEISQNSQEKNLCQSYRPEDCNFIKKETLAQVFPCEFCKISKNTFLQNTSGQLLLKKNYLQRLLPTTTPNDDDTWYISLNSTYLAEFFSGIGQHIIARIQRGILNPVKRLRWIFSRKYWTFFSHYLLLRKVPFKMFDRVLITTLEYAHIVYAKSTCYSKLWLVSCFSINRFAIFQ